MLTIYAAYAQESSNRPDAPTLSQTGVSIFIRSTKFGHIVDQ